jgi:hypothetical protein
MLAVVGGLLTFGTRSSAAVVCHDVDARGEGQDLGGGKTTAEIRGDRLLRGSTTASFVITGVTGNVAAFIGVVLFDLKRGALAVSVNGTFDLATGAFLATSTALTGAGKLATADGSLTLAGVQNLTTGAFTETITGEVCVEQRH